MRRSLMIWAALAAACSSSKNGSDLGDMSVQDLAGDLALSGSRTWQQRTSPVPNKKLYAVWGSSATDIWIVGESGTILHSNNGGSTFTQSNNSGTSDLLGVWGSSASNVYAVGRDTILRYNGSSWQSLSSPVTANYDAIWGSGASDVWIGGDASTVLRSTDGSTFNEVTTPSIPDVLTIWGGSATDVYVGCLSGVVIYSADSGANWTDRSFGVAQQNPTTGLEPDIHAIAGIRDNEVYAVGTLGAVFYTLDQGQHWTAPMTVPLAAASKSVNGAAAAGRDQVFVVGQGGLVLRSINHGLTFEAQTTALSQDLNAIWAISSDAIAVGANSTILHY